MATVSVLNFAEKVFHSRMSARWRAVSLNTFLGGAICPQRGVKMTQLQQRLTFFLINESLLGRPSIFFTRARGGGHPHLLDVAP